MATTKNASNNAAPGKTPLSKAASGKAKAPAGKFPSARAASRAAAPGRARERAMQWVFTGCACLSILAVGLICLFLFANGLPTLFKIGPLDFLLGATWKPGSDIYGILPMILGSIYVTAGAMVVGVPIGLLTALYLSRFAPPRVNRVMLPAVQLLAGIPSVVYGFFGMVVLVPAVQAMVKTDFFRHVLGVRGGKGMSLFTASLLLGMMILPTIITVSKTSLDAVPASYYEGSLALGATHERSVFFTVLPAARSGVLSAVILGIGRAIGETMAVVMVAGNQTWMPQGLFRGLRTMTANIVIEMGYAAGLHREALIATGVVLFVFILLINLCFSLVKGGRDHA